MYVEGKTLFDVIFHPVPPSAWISDINPATKSL